jgi:LacI family transcriptional regulator, galactose operon repressor
MQKNVPLKRVTITDLARELGVSDRAVSQALHPRQSNVRLNPKTVERIRNLAEKRNYRTDTSARAMRTGRFLNLGYFEAKPYPTDLPLRGSEDGIHDGASRHGYRVVLIKISMDASEKSNPIPAVFSEAHLDALIVSNVGHLSPECKEAITASGLPVVYLNEKEPKNSVYVDDLYGAQRITTYLVEQGYRRICLLATCSSRVPDPRFRHYSVDDRVSGYKKALALAGLPADVLHFSPDWQRELREWLKAHRDLDAIVCPADFAALRLFQVLYKHQIRVPEDIAVTGYGDDFSNECPVALTTMRIPFYEMGVSAAEMAVELCSHPKQQTIPSAVFRPELVIRDSTLPFEMRKAQTASAPVSP